MYDVIDVNSDIFKDIKFLLLDNKDENIVIELEDCVIDLIDTLKSVDTYLNECSKEDYNERISVI